MNPLVEIVYMLDDAAALLKEFLQQMDPPGKGTDGPCMDKTELRTLTTDWLKQYDATQPPSSGSIG
jgi:hypothetical protein